jgi:hypothetical protein
MTRDSAIRLKSGARCGYRARSFALRQLMRRAKTQRKVTM